MIDYSKKSPKDSKQKRVIEPNTFDVNTSQSRGEVKRKGNRETERQRDRDKQREREADRETER